MKYTFILFLLLITSNTKAQSYPTPVTDTLNYLRYIVSNKQQFIGQPFSTLHNLLLINSKMFTPSADIHYKRFAETSMMLAFKYAATAEDLYDTYPQLDIIWQPPFLNYYDALGLYSFYNQQGIGWNAVIYNRYQNLIIKDIFLHE